MSRPHAHSPGAGPIAFRLRGDTLISKRWPYRSPHAESLRRPLGDVRSTTIAVFEEGTRYVEKQGSMVGWMRGGYGVRV